MDKLLNYIEGFLSYQNPVLKELEVACIQRQ